MNLAVVVGGVALSLGRFPVATARLTYDRRKAESGGYVYAAARAEQADDEAIRVSEALIVTAGSSSGRVAAVAREHEVPALLLPDAAWKDGALVVETPVLGPERRDHGLVTRVVQGFRPLALAEGSVVSIDAEHAALRVVSPDEQDDELALAQAMRGYEGLQDPQALLNWYASRSDHPEAGELAARLYAEAAASIADGLSPPSDAVALAKGLGAKADAPQVARREARRWAKEATELQVSLTAAGTAAAAARLEAEIEKRWAGVSAVCAAGGLRAAQPNGAGLAALARSRRAALARSGGLTLAQAAKAAGVSMPPVKLLAPSLYVLFVKETGLGPLVDDVAQDASLRLGQMSQRVVQLFAAAKLPPESDVPRQILAAFPTEGRARVSGEDDVIDGVARDGALEAVTRAWSSSWDAGPLGERKRAGGLEPSPTVTIAAEPRGQTGTLYSRDPGDGRRRVVISWSGQQFVLSPEGRPLISPAGAKLPLSALEVLARLARGLDAYFGGGAQASFAYAPDSGVELLDARLISPSR